MLQVLKMHKQGLHVLAILVFLDTSCARKEPQKSIRTVKTNGDDEVDVIIENTSVTDR